MSVTLQRLALLVALAPGCTVDMPSRGEGAPDAESGEVDALHGRSEAGLPVGGEAGDTGGGVGADPGAGGSTRDGGSAGRDTGAGGVATDALPTGGGFIKPDAHVTPIPDAGGAPPDAGPTTPPPDAAPPPPCVVPPEGPVPETCNGLDDDCNGAIDDLARCGDFVAEHCRAWLVWADQAMPAAGAVWGACPEQSEDYSPWHDQNVVCNSSHGDGDFHPVPFAGNVDATDMLGVGLTCDPAAGPVSAWVQAHCRVYVGQVDVAGTDVLPDDTELWGGCPAANEGVDAVSRCVGSGGDGQFHAMSLAGDVNSDDRFAIAFRCEAPPGEGDAGAQRAAMHTAAVRVYLGFSTDSWVRTVIPYDTWGECPDADRDSEGDYRCVSTARDGRFHAVSLAARRDSDVDGDDMFSIAMRSAEE